MTHVESMGTNRLGQRIRRALRSRAILPGVALLLLVGIGLYHQPYYPVTWLDEGFVLQGAMNLEASGQYALRSSEGIRVLDQPLIANGPGVVIPIALTYAFAGPGLMQARVAMVGFLIAAALLFYVLGKRLSGAGAALCGVLLLFAVPSEGFLLYARHALGTIPALVYFCAGYLLWALAVRRERRAAALAAGVLFGLAAITKGQYAIVVAALALMVLWDLVFARSRGIPLSLIVTATAAGVFALWFAVQWATLGTASFVQQLDAIRSSGRVTVAAFEPIRLPGSLWYLVRSGMFFFVGPGWCLAAWNCWKERAAPRPELLIVLLVPLWSVWYAFVSVGWPRYAFEPYAIGLLLTGAAAMSAVRRLRSWRVEPVARSARLRVEMLALAAWLLVGGSWAAVGLGQQVRLVLQAPDTSAQEFAQGLLRATEPDAVIESWEWEIDALAARTYHHPTNAWVDRYTALTQFGRALTEAYDPAVFRPDYIVDGPFSQRTGIYQAYLESGCCTLAFHTGRYDLYRVVK